MTKPELKAFRDLPVLRSWSDFDSVGLVKSALTSLENGQFLQAAQLVDAMGRDDRIFGVTQTRVQGLLGLPVEFEPHGDGRKGKAVAKEVEQRWWDMFPETALADLVKWGLWLGIGVGELVWTTGEKRWDLRLKVWHPQYIWWRWDTRSYWVTTQDGPVEITPGDGKWVVYAPWGVERGWYGGLVRRLGVLWLIRQWAYRDWARYSEVHGLPTRKAKVPYTATQEDKDRFFDEIRQLANEPVMLLEQTEKDFGFDLELVEAQANTWEGFQQLIAQVDAAIAVAVLGQNLTTEVKGGSRAAAEVHDTVRQALLEYDAETLSTTLRTQALKPWAEFNFGDRELAPSPCIETEPPEDRKARADALNTLATAIATFRSAQVPVDVETILEEAGVPLSSAPAPEPPAPEAPPAKLSQADLPRGVLAGQLYTDAIADEAVGEATNALHPDVQGLMADVAAASSYDDLRTRLRARYRGFDATRLAKAMERALLLAELNGQYRILEGL